MIPLEILRTLLLYASERCRISREIDGKAGGNQGRLGGWAIIGEDASDQTPTGDCGYLPGRRDPSDGSVSMSEMYMSPAASVAM